MEETTKVPVLMISPTVRIPMGVSPASLVNSDHLKNHVDGVLDVLLSPDCARLRPMIPTVLEATIIENPVEGVKSVDPTRGLPLKSVLVSQVTLEELQTTKVSVSLGLVVSRSLPASNYPSDQHPPLSKLKECLPVPPSLPVSDPRESPLLVVLEESEKVKIH